MNKEEVKNIKYRFDHGNPLELTEEMIKYYEEEADKIGTAINGGFNFGTKADESFVFNLPISVYSRGYNQGYPPFLKEIIYMPYNDMVWYITPSGSSSGWVSTDKLDLVEFVGPGMQYAMDVDIGEAKTKTRERRMETLHKRAAKLFSLSESENVVKVNMLAENFLRISDKLFLTYD